MAKNEVLQSLSYAHNGCATSLRSSPSKISLEMGPATDGTNRRATPSSLQTLPPSRICDSDWENGERLIEEVVLQPQI